MNILNKIIFRFYYYTDLWKAVKFMKKIGKDIKFYKEKEGGHFYDKNKIWFTLPGDEQIYSIKNNKLHKPNPWFLKDPCIDFSKKIQIDKNRKKHINALIEQIWKTR